MKHSKNTLTALFSVLLFAITGTAFAAYSAKPVTYIRQTCEDCYTCVIAPDNANTGEAKAFAEIDLFSFLDPAVENETVKNQWAGDPFTDMTYRKVFNAIKSCPEFGGKIITRGKIKLLQTLGTSGNVNFNFFPGDGAVSQLSGEVRLKIQDSFFSIEHGVCVGKIASGASANTFQPEFFPNPSIFTDATELAALKTFYGTGLMKVLIDSKIYYQYSPVTDFEESIYNISGAVPATGGTAPAISTMVGDKSGIRPCIPMLLYNGASSIDFSISLAASVAMGGTAGTTNLACYQAQGFWISGGALSAEATRAVMDRVAQKLG